MQYVCPRCKKDTTSTYYGPCIECVEDINSKVFELQAWKHFLHCICKRNTSFNGQA